MCVCESVYHPNSSASRRFQLATGDGWATDVLYPLMVLLTGEHEQVGSGFRVQGSGFRVQGSGFRVRTLSLVIAFKIELGWMGDRRALPLDGARRGGRVVGALWCSTGVPRSSETALPPRTTIKPYV